MFSKKKNRKPHKLKVKLFWFAWHQFLSLPSTCFSKCTQLLKLHLDTVPIKAAGNSTVSYIQHCQ